MLIVKYIVNPSIMVDPELCLGADIGKVHYCYISYALTMSSDYYAKEDIGNVKKHMKDEKMDFNEKLSDINYSPNNSFSEVEYTPDMENSA